ncbi:uncharacterized protein LOC122293848 [Carya illinoinensis]|uniref:uncharacterized protein LOC122293848 n=1 Tax=Carya illinoinensis TaxID=32201 RepID=UPI001C720844|nr:uncharacterized protein LOC122293848 [Carya illinoinensis]
MMKLATHLKCTKVALRAWDKTVFGRVEGNIRALEERMDILEEKLQLDFSEELEDDFLATKIELDLWEKREASRLGQLAKKKWLNEDGRVLESAEVVHSGAESYFQNFLNENSEVESCALGELVDEKVSEDDNEMLCAEPTEMEVKQAIFFIPKNSSPGPDGFGFEFYMVCWDIVKEDVIVAARDFFRGTPLPRFYSSSFIVLIPKVPEPTSFDKFRPISLCSVVYKIFSKIIVNRLTGIIDKVVSHEQGAFVPGRSIFENITLAQEMVHSLNKKTVGGNVMLKIDMAKAYDRVNWDFLLKLFRAFGFSERFCRLIGNCIKSPWFSILMNGTLKGFFNSSRGLRQGDPLSPYLFIVMEEILTRLLRKNFEEGRIGKYHHPIGAPLVSHIFYADDVLIFVNGGKCSIKNLMHVLELYEKWSGQKINKQKSALFASKKIASNRKRSLLRITGFREVMNVPFSILSRINSLLANFLWGETANKRKLHWMSWKKVCKPTKEGGLGIRDFKEVQKSLHMKFAFRLIATNNLWTDFFRAKYSRNAHVLAQNRRPTDSCFWKSIISVLQEVVDNVKVLVRGGNASFWFDRWLSSGLLSARAHDIANLKLRISDCWTNNSWNTDLLRELVDADTVTDIILHVPVGKRGVDKMVWMPSSDVNFSTSTAWEVSRSKGQLLPGYGWFWHNCLPTRISMCMWRSWFNSLAVDDRIQHKGVSLASACDCCLRRQTESIDHIFSWGEVATQVWVFASTEMGIPSTNHWSWKSRVLHWFNYAKKSSIKGTLIGGGGIIRDSHGLVKGAFSTYYGHGTNNSAKLKAIVEGVRLGKRLHMNNIIIESDSKIVVDWIRTRKCTLWYLWDFWDELCEELRGMTYMVEHQFREANFAADFLAREGERGRTKVYDSIQRGPRLLKGIVRTDSLGLPSFRF